MAKDPAFLFYPNDWIGGTMGMTFEQKGVYIELLMLQFNRGHMTEHMIAQSVGQMFGQVKDKFKKDDNGLWYNERLDLEKQKRKSYVSSRYNNIEGKNQFKKTGHMSNHMEDVNENINTVINGVEIFKENSVVKLSDGTFQPLGKSQKVRAINDDIQPEEILKGKIY